MEGMLKDIGNLSTDYDTFNKWFYRDMEREDQENVLAEAYLTISLMAEMISERYTEVNENICPHCGKKNDVDARFCNYCGKKIEES